MLASTNSLPSENRKVSNNISHSLIKRKGLLHLNISYLPGKNAHLYPLCLSGRDLPHSNLPCLKGKGLPNPYLSSLSGRDLPNPYLPSLSGRGWGRVVIRKDPKKLYWRDDNEHI